MFLVLALAMLALAGGDEEVTETATAEAEPTPTPSESRTAYSDQSDAEALATDRDGFDGLLDGPVLKWPPAHPGEEIHGYLNDHTAIVTEADDGRGLIESTLPLRGETPTGDTAPIDLSLVDAGDTSFTPRSSAAAVRIPDESTGELRFPDQSFSVRLVGADPQDANIESNKAFFANVIEDGDLVIEPRPAGAELSLVLRSAAAPTSPELRFDLADGQTLRHVDVADANVPAGSVEVVQDSKRIAVVYPAVAVDAAGQNVPVSYELDGSRLAMHVGTGPETTYPVLVDPPVGVYDNYGTSVGAGVPAGYKWTGWTQATSSDAAGNPLTWSFCNNQQSYPSRKFYFCQGSLTGSNVDGGGIFIKANAGQTYADESWAQWVKEAPAGAYIYKLDATDLSNFAPLQGQLAVGVRTAAGTSWEWGSVKAGNGATDSGDAAAPTGYSYPAAYRTPSNVALSGATRYLFVHKADWVADPAPSAAIAPKNKAVLRMFMSGVTASSPPPHVSMGGAATYESETTAPTITSVTHTNPPPASNAWVDSYTDTVAATANDVGLGMGTIKLTTGSSTLATNSACTLNGPPVSGSTAQTKNHYDSCPLSLALPGTTYTAPEGANTYVITATDLVQNSRTTSWPVRVDKTPPSALTFTGGTLTGQDDQLVHGSTTVDFSATDAYSGVKAVKMYVDDTLVDSESPATTCSTSSCAGTLTGQLTFDADARNADDTYRYAEGTHTIKVAAEDPLAGGSGSHVTSRSFTVVIDRTAPTVGVSGPLSNAEDGTRLTVDNPTVAVEALDEPEPIDGTETGVPTAGVRTVEIKLDGVASPAAQRFDQSCSGGGCAMNHDFQVSTSQLGNGTHTANVIATDFAGNVSEQTWDFVIDRTSAKPLCSDPDADPDDCAPELPSTAAPDCMPVSVPEDSVGGDDVTADEALATTRATMPAAVGESDQATAENLDLAPAVDDSTAGFASRATLETSKIGASVPSYTVGAGFDATCVAPTSTTTNQDPPKPVTNGATDAHPDAVEYADTGASTDTILRANPNGVHEVTQIRDGAAPESRSYEITAEPNQYLKQLDSGAVAVIDTSIPTTSGSLPEYDLGTQTPPLDPDDPGEDHPDDDYDPADDTYTDQELAELTPDSSDVSPTDTQDQYDSDSRVLQVANDESDGQAVAVITPPAASDDSGTAVPTSLTADPVTNRVTITTEHQSAGLAYPVTVAHKTLVTAAKHKVDYGLSVTLGTDLFARKLSNGQGAPRLRKGLNARWARYNMYYHNSCDYFIPEDGNFAGDMPPDPETLPQTTENQRFYRESARRCRRAIDFIDKTFDAGLTPYITLIADRSLPKNPLTDPNASRRRVTPKEYAQSAVNLWKTAPFSQVKHWGPTNEPDGFAWLADKPAAYAANIYVAMVDAAHDPKRGAYCKKCKISAGGFARSRGVYTSNALRYPAYNNHGDYVKAYMNRLTHLNRHPKRWEFHDYPDTGNEAKVYKDPIHRYKPKKVSYPQLQTFIKFLNDRPKLDPKHAKIWIMEAGVKLFAGDDVDTPATNEGRSTELDGRGNLQIEAALRFKYFSSFRKVSVVSYYQVFGRDAWDTAVLTPPDRAGQNPDVDPPPESAYDPTVIPNNREFRKVYCVLTKQTTQQNLDSLCPAVRHRPAP